MPASTTRHMPLVLRIIAASGMQRSATAEIGQREGGASVATVGRAEDREEGGIGREQNGADFGSYGDARDTALDAAFMPFLMVNEEKAFWIADSAAPEHDFVMVAVNDPAGGGTAGWLATWSVSAWGANTALHEFGHLFAGLADEYDVYIDHYPCQGDCGEPNVTLITDPDAIKWKVWIEPNTPLPTPNDEFYRDAVGLFEGARYEKEGVYRPQRHCRMRGMDWDYLHPSPYCRVCAEAMVWAVYRNARPIDAFAPADGGEIRLSAGERATFSITRVLPTPDTHAVTWTVDGEEVAAGVDQVDLPAEGFGTGTHPLTVTVRDTIEHVRRDPWGLLVDTRSWTVEVDSVLCQGAAYCYVDGACREPGAVDPANPCQVCRPDVARLAWTPDDSRSCDDGDFCTGVERCEAGRCVSAGHTCDDGVYCNGAEGCTDGGCRPGVPPCSEDGHACTRTCDEGSRKCSVIDEGACLIGGTCVAAGASLPDRPCRVCDPEASTWSWTELADDALCDAPCAGADCPEGVSVTGTRSGCASATGDPLLRALALVAFFFAALRRRWSS